MKKLYVVATPIGNLLDLSDRAKQVLGSVDAVLAEDTRVTSKLLFKFGIKKPIFSCYKFNETGVASNLSELFKSYNTLALVSDAGTPAVSDPGAIVVNKARELDINIETIPGPSAVISAISLCGINKTEFAFMGFFPREKKEQNEICKTLSSFSLPIVVFYESPKRIVATLELLEKQVDNIQKVFVFNDLTKQFEKHYVGDIGHVINMLRLNENATLGEYVFVLELKPSKQIEQDEYSFEARLVDNMVKNNCNVKQAIENLSKSGLNKNQLYKASLNLKNKF